MTEPEIDEGIGYAGFEEALALVRANTEPIGIIELPLASCPGYVVAETAYALVDSPRQDTSLKDGFAVRASDVAAACPERPSELDLIGSSFAGVSFNRRLLPGQTIKITTGAPIPDEADAVVSSELCDELGCKVRFRAGAGKGKNVMSAGEEVRAGMTMATEGQMLTPAGLAFAAAAGISGLRVYRKPRIGILSIGDELVAPGHTLRDGGRYASNAVNIGAWLSLLKVPFVTSIVGDEAWSIKNRVLELEKETDTIITNGGLMNGDRDFVLGSLGDLAWTTKFRHVRMGPGKGTSFGVWRSKPIFCLSGSPSSSMTAFRQLVLPGLYNMVGLRETPPTALARLARDVHSRNVTWTEFRQARLERNDEGGLIVDPLSEKSALRSMAEADCLLCKPEGIESLRSGQFVRVHLMHAASVAVGFNPCLNEM